MFAIQKSLLLLSFFLITGIPVSAQWQPDESQKGEMKHRMYRTIEFLVGDSLKGRESGTKGDTIASNYIESRFAELGLSPVFSDQSFVRSFTYSSDTKYSHHSTITINKAEFHFEKSFTILNYTGKSSFQAPTLNIGYGMVNSEQNIDDYQLMKIKDFKDKIFLMDVSFPEKYDFIDAENYYIQIQENIYAAAQKEPSAIILYQSAENRFLFNRHAFFQNSRSFIPIIYADEDLKKALLAAPEKEVSINIETERKEETSFNIAAMVDNQVSTYIIIGAHYDHLGYGSPISRHTGVPAIHYGADDNASGVAMVLEIAEFISKNKLTNHNYIFVAFGAEEKGLIGSKEFMEDTLINQKHIIAMINLDMVGRLDSVTHKLNVIGSGTSNLWDSLLTIVTLPTVEFAKNPAPGGGSDHVSFYLQNIPVLFFITGLHKDYHTPKDVISKINFDGMVDIAIIMNNLMIHLNNVSSMPYVKIDNKGTQSSRNKGGVSLGVIPDHAYGGKGMRIDDVTSGRPADLAGLKGGDIIIAFDQSEVTDITSYMKALSQYQKGSKAIVTFLRDEKELTLEVTF